MHILVLFSLVCFISGTEILATKHSYVHSKKILENSSIDAMQFDLQRSSMYAMSKNEVTKVDFYRNCTAFSNCSECVGAKDLYCGWCPQKSSCTLESDCLDEYGSTVSWKNYRWYQNGSLTQTICASPVLTPNLTDFNFFPTIVLYGSKSTITISTQNFFKKFSQWLVTVKIAGIECDTQDIILPSTRLYCIVQANQICQGKILIQQFEKAIISTYDIQFVDPTIIDFTPKYGPISGGTLITITGQYLNAGRSVRAYIGDLSCNVQIAEKNQVICKNVQSNRPQSLKLRMTFDDIVREYENELFQYGNDPTVVSVATTSTSQTALKCIPAGGLDITVHGTNLKIVQNPRIRMSRHIIFNSKRFHGDCTAYNDTVMTCVSPIIDLESEHLNVDDPIRLEFGFNMDGVEGVQDLSIKGFPKFEVFPNPSYNQFTEMVKYIENKRLTITGKNLNLVCEESDVRVFIGEHLCNITTFTQNFLECQPPLLFEKNGFFKVIVKVGRYLQFDAGIVSYDRPVNKFLYTIVVIVSTLSSVITICIAVLSFRIFYYRRLMRDLKAAGLQHFQEGDVGSIDPNLPLGEQTDLMPYNKKYEFPRERLKLGEILGSGEFGVVHKAIATKIVPNEDESTVAVKMVKRNYGWEVIRALAMELKIMIHLGPHKNVVNLLGAVTKNIKKRELMIIVEYCPFGSLKKYLETNRDYFVDQIDRNTDEIDSTIQAQNTNYNHTNLENKVNPQPGPSAGYTKLCYVTLDHIATARSPTADINECERLIPSNSMEFEDRSFSTIELLNWALQVVHGMKHLQTRNVIHGDLAARNILLCENNEVKICDFGLARSVYKTGIYWKKGEEALPFKWMALESIMDRKFTTKSDVWSFGIVLYELFSLGQEPYLGAQLDEHFVNNLSNEIYLNKPNFCTERIYKLMLSCWCLDPEERPSFDYLEQEIFDILKDASVN